MGQKRTERLADIISPMTERAFLTTVWGERVERFRGKPGRFEHLLPWSELNRLVTEHRLGPPRVRLSRGGKDRPLENLLRRSPQAKQGVSRAEFDIPSLTRELQSGTMLVVDAADEASAPIRRLAENLERTLGESVQANVYAGWKRTRGFATHCDTHDVLILQIFGRKNWRVFSPGRDYPLPSDVRANSRPHSPPLWQGTLNSGDALYIPRGWWHDAMPFDEATLHVTLTTAKRTGIDLMDYLVERLKDSPVFRKDLPRFAPAAKQEEHMRRLRSGIEEAASRLDLRAYLADQAARAPARERLSVPFSVTRTSSLRPDDIVCWLPPRDITLKSGARGDVSFRALGQEWIFDRSTHRVLEALAADRRSTVAALRRAEPRFSRRKLASFLFELMSRGLIAVGSS